MNAVQFNNLNKTPVRTKKWLNINDISINELEINEINPFNNVKVKCDNNGVTIEKINNDKIVTLNRKFIYGVSEELITQGEENFNQGYLITINKNVKLEEPLIIEFNLDKDNNTLVDNFIIVSEENSKGNIIVKYTGDDDSIGYHNGICRIYAKRNSEITVAKVNLLNENTAHFDSTVSNIEDNGKVNFITADMGGKYSITNYHGDLIGEASKSNVDSIYLGDKDKVIDINYINTHKGKRSKSNIITRGAIQGEAKKTFKGTIDFVKGASKSVGAEDEYCIMLSKKARAKAMPILLCGEEDVSGEHAASSGKIDENKLFYLMCRGFTYDQAKIVIVRAALNPIIDKIEDSNIKEEILKKIEGILKNE